MNDATDLGILNNNGGSKYHDSMFQIRRIHDNYEKAQNNIVAGNLLAAKWALDNVKGEIEPLLIDKGKTEEITAINEAEKEFENRIKDNTPIARRLAYKPLRAYERSIRLGQVALEMGAQWRDEDEDDLE